MRIPEGTRTGCTALFRLRPSPRGARTRSSPTSAGACSGDAAPRSGRWPEKIRHPAILGCRMPTLVLQPPLRRVAHHQRQVDPLPLPDRDTARQGQGIRAHRVRDGQGHGLGAGDGVGVFEVLLRGTAAVAKVPCPPSEVGKTSRLVGEGYDQRRGSLDGIAGRCRGVGPRPGARAGGGDG